MAIVEVLTTRLAASWLGRVWRAGRRRLTQGQAAALLTQQIVDDFVTGTGQAVIAVRFAVEVFTRQGVLVDPDHMTLEEGSARTLNEAERTTDEAEARLGRVLVRVGTTSRAGRASSAVVESLREAVRLLHEYVRQHGAGRDAIVRATAKLAEAERHQREAAEALARR